MIAGQRCEAHDGTRRCSREDGHDGLHDCGYSFAGIVEDIHAKKLTGTVHFLHGRPKLADLNGQRVQIDVNGCLMQD